MRAAELEGVTVRRIRNAAKVINELIGTSGATSRGQTRARTNAEGSKGKAALSGTEDTGHLSC